MLKYASVCSGIEAATVAWKHMNWKAVWLSEIESFPCEVLAHHYPETPNLGDMTKLKGNDIYEQSNFDVLVGGTPCQSFSIAGLRGGMVDQRGNLALEYCRILIDKSPRWFVWENVPGVFSSFSDAEGSKVIERDGGERGDGDCITETSDFATLLTAFRECGYSCAWRVFDSRHFGVPQRRRRVFVVGYIGKDWRPPVAVLFERESLRRDFTPSRKARKATTASTATGTQGGDINCQPNGISGAMTSKWAKGTGGPAGDEHYNLIVQPAYGTQANIVNRSEKSGANGLGVKEEMSFTLTKNDQHCVMQPLERPTTFRAKITLSYNGKTVVYQDPEGEKSGVILEGEYFPYYHWKEGNMSCDCNLAKFVGLTELPCGETIEVVSVEPVVEQPASSTKVFNVTFCDSNGVRNDRPNGGLYVNETTESKTLTTSQQNETVVVQPIVIDRAAFNQGVNAKYDAQIEHSETAPCLVKVGPHAVMTQPTICYEDVVLRGFRQHDDVSPTVVKFWGTGGGNVPFVQQSMVRRLTPLECCRLQGFPDSYLDGVPNASDSKWYAAFGNSMTVNVMKWIGERIDKVDKLITKLNSK